MPSPWSFQFRQTLRVLALCVPMVAAFVFFVLPIASILAWIRGTPITASANVLPAVLCGLIAGLFVVVFHVKKESTLVPFKNRHDFLAACHLVLNDLGYEVAERPDQSLVSWPSFRALLLGGHIHILPLANEGRITGPKVFVEILRSRLRLHSHITGVEQTLNNNRARQPDRLLKRVQVSFRLTPDQWDDAGKAVVGRLVEAGAEVCCDIHLLAHSLEGIRESIVEGSVRDWLLQEGIQVDVHKDHSRWDMNLPREPGEDTVVLGDSKQLAT